MNLLMHFIRRILEINRNGKDMCDGVSAINLIIAVFENLIGQIDAEVPMLLDILLGELQFLEARKDSINYKKYKGMVMQAFSMCFNYNAGLTFQVLEAKGATLSVFQSWFVFMNDFKKDFEIRRIILGLSAIVHTQPLPAIVDQKLPDVMNQLTLLAINMNSERYKILRENQDTVANAGKDLEDEEFEAGQEDDGDENFEDSDEEWKKQQKALANIAPKLQSGQKLTKEEMKEVAIDDFEDDDADSDYEYMGGDMSLYESRIEEFDELQNLKNVLVSLEGSNGAVYQRIVSGIADPSVLQKLQEILANIEQLSSEEKAVQAQLDALDMKPEE